MSFHTVWHATFAGLDKIDGGWRFLRVNIKDIPVSLDVSRYLASSIVGGLYSESRGQGFVNGALMTTGAVLASDATSLYYAGLTTYAFYKVGQGALENWGIQSNGPSPLSIDAVAIRFTLTETQVGVADNISSYNFFGVIGFDRYTGWPSSASGHAERGSW